MLCDNCNKNEATIHYTEVINGVKKERHLCSECMQEFDGGIEGEIPFSKLIRGILSAHLNNMSQEHNPVMHICCDKCGMTYSEFTKVGKFGCGECYSVFGPLIIDNIKKIQGNATHTGKRYKRQGEKSMDISVDRDSSKMSIDIRIKQLDAKLKAALKVEDYEEAARLRDEIKLLKGKDGKDA